MTQAGVGDARASWRAPGRGADQFQRLSLTGPVPGAVTRRHEGRRDARVAVAPGRARLGAPRAGPVTVRGISRAGGRTRLGPQPPHGPSEQRARRARRHPGRGEPSQEADDRGDAVREAQIELTTGRDRKTAGRGKPRDLIVAGRDGVRSQALDDRPEQAPRVAPGQPLQRVDPDSRQAVEQLELGSARTALHQSSQHRVDVPQAAAIPLAEEPQAHVGMGPGDADEALAEGSIHGACLHVGLGLVEEPERLRGGVLEQAGPRQVGEEHRDAGPPGVKSGGVQVAIAQRLGDVADHLQRAITERPLQQWPPSAPAIHGAGSAAGAAARTIGITSSCT